MANTKVAIVAFLLIAILVGSSVPAVDAYNCVPDCIERCSNGKNLESCETMCKTACLPAKAATAAAENIAGATGIEL